MSATTEGLPTIDDDESGEENKRPSAAVVLVNLAMERYRFAATPDGDAFGVPSGGHVVRMLRGGRASLRAELAKEYRRRTGQVAAQQALANALITLEGEAQDADPVEVSLRTAIHAGTLWIDLGDADEHVVHVTPAGWEVTPSAPVLFRRTPLTGALPVPQLGGDLGELWRLLNVAEADRPLILGWLVAALVMPDAPVPALAVAGEQGTGKSTASRMLVDLVDPSPVPLRKPPRDEDSWVVAASGSRVVGLDNMSSVTGWLSDTLCRSVTGDGDVRRQLYTDGEQVAFSFKRAILLNGIDLGALRGDLAERLMLVQLDRIPESNRATEKDLDAAWKDARPRLFGALLTKMAEVLAGRPSVRLDRKPRMADFAQVLAVLDGQSGNGLDRYLEQSRKLSVESLTSNPFIVAMMESLDGEFIGTSAELLEKVTPDVPPRKWPTARQVTTLLHREAPALRGEGWTVEDLNRSNHKKVVCWQITPPHHETEMGRK